LINLSIFSNIPTDILALAVVLGVMIFVHELGHFMAAKYFGVRVIRFSLGFPPRLFGIKRGDTDYCVGAVPLGGYVKMAGDDPTLERQGDPGEFLSKPRWQRFVIVLMGPAMNVVLAVGLLACLDRYHYEKAAYREEPARIAEVAPDSPAAKAGILSGDLIVRLGGLSNPKWEDVQIKVLTTVNESLPMTVLRDGRELELSVTPKAEGPDALGDVGWAPYIPAILDEVESGTPAEKAGLKPGDQIAEVDGRQVSFWTMAETLQSSNGKPVRFTVQRDGKTFPVEITPVYSEMEDGKKWRIGVKLSQTGPVIIRQLPWGQAIAASVDSNIRNSLLAFDVLAKILTRRLSPRGLSGPIGITQMAGLAFRSGLSDLVGMMSMISMQLAIFNVLPIPVLDGGVMLLLLIEGAIRHDLSLKVKERFVQAGLAFLLLLVAVVTYFDLLKTFRPS